VTIESLRAELPILVRHIHAAGANPVEARNAALKASRAAWVVLLGERMIPQPGWLRALLTQAMANKADVVFGVTRSQFPADTPAWMAETDVQPREAPRADNVILRRGDAAWASLSFDTARTRDGEDAAFYFRALRKAGARFADAADAIAHLPVEPPQIAFGQLWREKSRIGRAIARVRAYDGANPMVEIARSATMSAACLAAAGGMAGSPAARTRWLLRAASHIGATGALLGFDNRRA
jgi:hypothetical protein